MTMARMIPVTINSACPRTGTGPSRHTACDGLEMYARGIGGHYPFGPHPDRNRTASGADGFRRSGWASISARADAGGQVGRQGAGCLDSRRAVRSVAEAADERGAHDDAVGEARDFARLVAVAHAEADGHREFSVLAGARHQ